MNTEKQEPLPLGKQPISLVFTEGQWIKVGAAVAQMLKEPGDSPAAQEIVRDLYPVALQIQQMLNRRMRDTGSEGWVFNFVGASQVNAEPLYGE